MDDGNQAAALARILIDENIPGMVGQILNIPVTCHPDHFPRSKYEYTSYEQNSQAPIVSAARMRQYWANYLPGATTDARANILLASSFVGLPPARLYHLMFYQIDRPDRNLTIGSDPSRRHGSITR